MSQTTAPEPFKSLIHEWGRSLRAENKSHRTIEGYALVAHLFHYWLSQTEDPPNQPDELASSHFRAWIGHRVDTTSPANANNNYRALQQWCNFLLVEEEIDDHPMKNMKPPKIPEKDPPVIPVEAVRAVLDGCSGKDFLSRRDTAVIRLLWDTGIRLSEIANLKLEDVDLKMDVIRVTGKGGKERSVPFCAKTGRAVSRYLRVRARQRTAGLDWLWLADAGKGRLKRESIRYMVKRRGDRAGIPEQIGRNFHPHLARHFASHHFQMDGGSEGDLMLLMGWTSPQMPKRYGRSAATARAHAASRKLRLGDRI